MRHDPWREDVNKELPVAGPLTKHRPKTQIAGVVMTTTVGHRSFAGKKKQGETGSRSVNSDWTDGHLFISLSFSRSKVAR